MPTDEGYLSYDVRLKHYVESEHYVVWECLECGEKFLQSLPNMDPKVCRECYSYEIRKIEVLVKA